MARQLSTGGKVAAWTAGIILGLVALAVLGVGVYVRFAFWNFYAEAEDEFTIPGIDQGFVCQDLDFYDPTKTWFFSGYSNDGGPSPIYRMNGNGEYTQIQVLDADGVIYKDHGAGITTTDKYAFLTCENGYLVYDALELLTVEPGESVQAKAKISLGFSPAFLNVENGRLYTGTFYRNPSHPAPEEFVYKTPSGTTNSSIMLAFPADDEEEYGFSTTADTAYSLPDLVQGACVLPNGNVVLSMSWGIQPSKINTYKIDEDSSTDMFQTGGRGVPLYFLDKGNLLESISAPPMSEGIEYHDGRVYISEESASDKYIFGKLYGAGQVYSLPM